MRFARALVDTAFIFGIAYIAVKNWVEKDTEFERIFKVSPTQANSEKVLRVITDLKERLATAQLLLDLGYDPPQQQKKIRELSKALEMATFVACTRNFRVTV